MPYLDAALAFALTMLAVASLVAQVVQRIRNTAKLRREGLQDMLNEFFDKEFKPVVERELNRLTTTAGEKVAASLKDTLAKFNASPLLDKIKAEGLGDMSTEEITERLKRSGLGEELLTKLGNQAQAVFEEMGKRYEVIGKKATESFRQGSKVWTTVIALVVALVLNVDSIYIANTYIKSENSRQVIIAQNDSFIEDYNTLSKTLEEEQGRESFTREELEQAFQDSREQIESVRNAGFPIGWSYFPHAYFQGERGSSADFQERNTAVGWFSWVLGIALTILLAGMGGPFWYDVVSGVSRAVKNTHAAAKKQEGLP
ncbi:MAG TPA: hypothetical protein VMJ90_01665 [Anaerolineales bacterium]|nr:hypothetical protein [Anaerolineales bacterium]